MLDAKLNRMSCAKVRSIGGYNVDTINVEFEMFRRKGLMHGKWSNF